MYEQLVYMFLLLLLLRVIYTICKAIHVEDEQILASLRTHHLAIHVSDNQTTYGLIFQPVTDNAHKIY